MTARMTARMQALVPRLQDTTILVVEDHEDSRDAVRQFLEALGARVLLAANGKEGLDRLAAESPDVTLCDLRMPVVDGYMFMERMRGNARLARAKVIAISAHGEPADIRRTWEAGFDGHLVKPVDPDVLLAALERTLWARFPIASPAAGPARRPTRRLKGRRTAR